MIMFLKEVLTLLPICIVYQSYAREIPVFHEINAAISESAGMFVRVLHFIYVLFERFVLYDKRTTQNLLSFKLRIILTVVHIG